MRNILIRSRKASRKTTGKKRIIKINNNNNHNHNHNHKNNN